jgi:hypothetical protein
MTTTGMTTVDSSLPMPPNAAVAAVPGDLGAQFRSVDAKKQLALVEQLIEAGEPGVQVLTDCLRDYQAQGCPLSQIGIVDPVAAKAYRMLYQAGLAHDFLKAAFPQGIVPLQSGASIDYHPLQELLRQQSWEEADKLNNLKLCEAASEAAQARKWVYFTEVNHIPVADLRTVNALWLAYSDGKFGYSVQREIWLGVNKNWDKFWPKILWKDGNTWTRYPGSFQWDLAAPRGHLPLSNQLRGVQMMNALMNHPAWVPDTIA